MKYNKQITIKKGGVVLLATAIASVVIDFILGGNIQLSSTVATSILLSVAKMTENYLKHQ